MITRNDVKLIITNPEFQMRVIDEIREWVSIKNYKEEAVAQDVLERVLEAGVRAPSAKNRQPWRFVVCRDSSIRNRIQEAAFGQEHVGQAPVIIAACTTNIEYKMPNGQLSYPVDLSMAVSFMMIQSRAEKLGACVVTTFNEAEVKDILSIPYSMRVVMLLLLGYPAEVPMKSIRKPVSRVVGWEHW